MTGSATARHRRRPVRALVTVLLLGAIAAALAILGPSLLGGLRSGGGPLLGAADCVVQTADGDVGLDREEAKLATTAVALRARGAEASDTSNIDDVVLRALAQGPSGDAGPVLSCRGPVDEDLQVEEMTASGLTPRAEQVRTAMTEVFGEQNLGGFAPGGVGQGHGEESTHYDGRAIDVFFRPVSEENRRAGWMLSHWLVAHAEELDIQYVIFDDQFWSARIARGRWHPYDAPAPANEILRHVDHVHVDVLKGGDE
ncbi:hypothetical protein FDK12_07715 [Arthrobacter sp. NamB2]|uniref:hypothetical protein n=1 Tax=Arthrobacter sp. NamB2 TaxID=2576035 RepID=UPI0010C947AE|nr:hypothetical protein [Arthrobacter sp. NamB2]TKV28539.1 hypothetical protein FDK12_07715 [Arthrobacter sp. NamB2]